MSTSPDSSLSLSLALNAGVWGATAGTNSAQTLSYVEIELTVVQIRDILGRTHTLCEREWPDQVAKRNPTRLFISAHAIDSESSRIVTSERERHAQIRTQERDKKPYLTGVKVSCYPLEGREELLAAMRRWLHSMDYQLRSTMVEECNGGARRGAQVSIGGCTLHYEAPTLHSRAWQRSRPDVKRSDHGPSTGSGHEGIKTGAANAGSGPPKGRAGQEVYGSDRQGGAERDIRKWRIGWNQVHAEAGTRCYGMRRGRIPLERW
ncbi:hypothetical protein BC827DRAFT_1158952 [Russula dissimulans]|nr:hypothetical protein BC827DRAFT_1158952 [Russula dissimulans]